MGLLFLFSLIIISVSLVGVVTASYFFESRLSQWMPYFVSFAAGVFLIVSGHLLYESLILSDSLFMGIFWVILGALVLFGVFWVLPMFHHHHSDSDDDHSHSQLDARRILIGDAVHNIGDGILLVGAFAVSSSVGIAAAVGIIVHEVVQEISEYAVLRQAGYTVKRALLMNFLTALTLLIGVGGALFFSQQFESFQQPLLGIAAGAFLVVVFFDLVPHSVRHSKQRVHILRHVGVFFVGLVLMSGITFFSSETHSHDSGHEHGTEAHETHDEHEDGHDDHSVDDAHSQDLDNH